MIHHGGKKNVDVMLALSKDNDSSQQLLRKQKVQELKIDHALTF